MLLIAHAKAAVLRFGPFENLRNEGIEMRGRSRRDYDEKSSVLVFRVCRKHAPGIISPGGAVVKAETLVQAVAL